MANIRETLKAANKELKEANVIIRYSSEYKEFSVNYISNGNNDNQAYYTDDLADAIGTARHYVKK